MRNFICLFLLFICLQQRSFSQPSRPKLVVGIVIDQMRWDYLYRYGDRYTDSGFNRLLNEGFSCENTMIPYTPTVTACGHTCVYTGSVPAIHGIVGNSWFSRDLKRNIYCVEDSTVTAVGSSSPDERMSPRNMFATTIGDELKIATNFNSKVIGIAIKDRGAILPAGHAANAAYWYEGSSGNFISSSFYMDSLPQWVNNFNAQKLPAKNLKDPWTTLYPLSTYTQSTNDDEPYEGKYTGETHSTFPHKLNAPGMLPASPYGNTFTLDFAKKAIEANDLGKGKSTDLLCISLSTPDYVGHQFGPNSIEAEDTYLRLDKDLGSFFSYLDKTIGKDQYVVFLTADHGVVNVPGFLKDKKLPAGNFNEKDLHKMLADSLNNHFGLQNLIISIDNYQIYLDHDLIKRSGKDLAEVKEFMVQQITQIPGVANAFDLSDLSEKVLPATLKMMLTNGYNQQRSGDIQYILKPGWLSGYQQTGTGHGVWYPYDAHIPLVWMGWGIKQGKTNTITYMTDIAATLAAMLHIQMPDGCVGKPIEAILNK